MPAQILLSLRRDADSQKLSHVGCIGLDDGRVLDVRFAQGVSQPPERRFVSNDECDGMCARRQVPW